MEKILWSELRRNGNKYMKKLEPLMLASEGVSDMHEIKPIGCKQKEWFDVIYNKYYVYEKIANDLINPLNLPLEKLIQLIVESYQYCNQQLTTSDGTLAISNQKTNQVIDLNDLKVRKLHGKGVYQCDELIDSLTSQGYAVVTEKQNDDFCEQTETA